MEKIRMRGKWLIILYLISIFFSFVFVPYKLVVESPDVPVGHYYVFADTLRVARVIDTGIPHKRSLLGGLIEEGKYFPGIPVVDYGRLVLQIMALTVLTLILYLWFYTTSKRN